MMQSTGSLSGASEGDARNTLFKSPADTVRIRSRVKQLVGKSA